MAWYYFTSCQKQLKLLEKSLTIQFERCPVETAGLPFFQPITISPIPSSPSKGIARSTYGSIRVSVSRREQVLPMQVSKFLQHPQNKLDLINFIIDDLQSTEKHIRMLNGKELYITFKDRAFCISSNGEMSSISEVPDLMSAQEEADTKICIFSWI